MESIMPSEKSSLSRRTLLRGMAVLPFVSLASVQQSAKAASLVSIDDPTAKALGYIESSTLTGKNCASCNLYTDTGGTSGPCAIFPGKEVLASGYCNSWIART